MHAEAPVQQLGPALQFSYQAFLGGTSVSAPLLGAVFFFPRAVVEAHGTV